MTGDPRAVIRRFVVHPDKLDRYLLNQDHPQGGSKAARLLRHNFDAATLAPVLIEQAQAGGDVEAWTSDWGTRLEIAEPIPTPLNTYLDVVTVWQVRPAEPETADFITLTFRDRT